MVVRKSETLEDYIEYIHNNNDEIKKLFSDILINVTDFFRDQENFKALVKKAFPHITKNKKAGAAIRIWVPGCSTGEEAYSIAISLIEFLGENAAKTPIQIFATDISETVIQKARAGVYPSSIQQRVGKERLNRFFTKVENGYKIKKEIRDLCMFSIHDITSDPPFSKIDLLSCRNLLIYFSTPLQKKVIPILHYALNSNGILFLGRSDTPGTNSKLFSTLDKPHKIYIKSGEPTPASFKFPVSAYAPDVNKISQQAFSTNKISFDFDRDSDRIALAKYAPPSVVVNASMDILQFRGRTVPYLEPPTGTPSTSLFKMAHQDLHLGLRMALLEASKTASAVRKDKISFEINNEVFQVSIEVVPLNPLAPVEQRNYIIFFEKLALPSQLIGTVDNKSKNKMQEKQSGFRIRELERDIATNKKFQISMSESFEAAQEELSSANEELQSTNEELQSTNEEMETAKEEIQSSNEELTTVNDELINRNSDLRMLSDDLNNILGSVDTPILIVDNSYRLRKFTPAAEKFFKLSPADIGHSINNFRAKISINLETLIKDVLHTLVPLSKEIQNENGNWLQLQIKPYKTTDNRIDGAVITLTDIEALKQQISMFKRNNDYLTSVSDTIPLPLVILDHRLHLISANNAFWQHFQLSQQITGKDFFTTLGIKDQSFHKLLTKILTNHKKIKNVEIHCDFPKIGQRTILVSANLIKWIGEMMHVQGTAEEPNVILLSFDDVTEQRLAEIRRRESEEKYRNFLTSAHDAIIIVTIDGTITFANKKAEKIFGYQTNELLELNCQSLIPEKLLTKYQYLLQSFMKAPKPYKMAKNQNVVGYTKDGREFPIEVSLGPLQTKDGILITCVIRDITDLKIDEEEKIRMHLQEKNLRSEAEKANRIKDEFLATLSHELRTPLTSILLWSQLIQRINMEPEKLMHGLKKIEQSAIMQGQLIDDLLDISRIRSGKLSVNFATLNPSELVNLSIEAVQPLAECKEIKIISEIKVVSEKIWGDRERIQQIVWNLLTNAIKFSNKGGLIQVRVEKVLENGNPFITIKVSDQGKGIKQEFLPKLFDRFSQEDSSSIRMHGGLGLGLAIVRDLVQLQGGTVRAESQGLDKGSCFTVQLPIKNETAITDNQMVVNNLPKLTGLPNLTNIKVMVVDDDPSTLEATSEALISFGAHIFAFSTVQDAVNQFDQCKPDILISDISMPVEDGYELIKKIRVLGAKNRGNIPALALTAYATENDVAKALLAGFDVHIAKPFDSLHFGHTVAKLIKRYLGANEKNKLS